jgi:hypothetical protein
LHRHGVLIPISPEPENAASARALLLEPKPQGLAHRLGPRQAALLALRIKRRAIRLGQFNDGAHE